MNVWLWMIVLLIGLLIILSALGPGKLKELVNPIFGDFFQDEAQSGTRVTGENTETDIPLLELVGTKNEIKQQLANNILSCWTLMRRGNYDKLLCSHVVWSNTTITRSELVKTLEQRDEFAAGRLEDNFDQHDLPESGNLDPDITYLVCADADWPDSDDLIITSNLQDDCS